MLNNGTKCYRSLHMTTLPHLKHLRKLTTDKQCLCGQLYFTYQRAQGSFYKNHNILTNSSIFKNVRVHSTQSDHRQKVVIETSRPVVNKLTIDKVLDKDIGVSKDKSWSDRIYPYVQLARWDKPVGVCLLYWPCAWSISLGAVCSGAAPGTALGVAGLFLTGAGLMRGAGCTINDMWDRDIDRQVARTENRPLASGVISYRQATAFLAIQLSAALLVLLQLNCTSVVLGASSMLLVTSYPLAKRYTNYPQLCLGATFNWGALLGYTAVTGSFDPYVCVPLYVGAMAWTVIYDTIYAHQDKLDDARIGIKSTALTFGPHTKPLLGVALVLSGACLAYAGHAAACGPAYAACVAAYAAHVATQIYTLDIDNPTDCAKKFNSNSLVGLIILLGILGGGYETYNKNRETRNYNVEQAKSCFFG